MTTPYCVVGCTRGTGLQIARQLAERGAPVLGVARDPVKARGLLPAAAEIRAGDVTDPSSLSAARLGACCAIFFAVTYEGLVNVVDAAKAAAFTGRFVLVSGMGSELPSFTSFAMARRVSPVSSRRVKSVEFAFADSDLGGNVGPFAVRTAQRRLAVVVDEHGFQPPLEGVE